MLFVPHSLSFLGLLAIALLACSLLGTTCGTNTRQDAEPTVAGPAALTPLPGLYVAPTGSDANPGTFAQPFATLEKARQAVRTINASMTQDLYVYVRGGRYELASPLVLGAADSGSNGYRVIYKAWADEVPVLSGGRRITTPWTLYNPTLGIWRADLPAGVNPRQLFVNGVRAQRACSAGGLHGIVDRTSTGYATTDTSAKAPRNWVNPGEVEFVYTGLPSGIYQWQESRCGVAGVSDETITMDQPCFANLPATCGSPPNTNCSFPARIENVLGELDEPGEWILNRAGNIIYYKPRAGDDMTTAEAIVPDVERLLMIEGAEGARVHHLRFEGLTFAHASWVQPNGGEGFIDNQANQILVGSPPAPTFPNAAVWLRFADQIDFVRNTVSQAGGQGIALDRGISDVTLIGNHVFDISSSGIRVGDFVTFDPTAPQVWRVTVANNHVHHVGTEFAGGVGIHVLDAAQTQVVHNEVGHTPYSGISLGWGWDWVEKKGWSQWARDNEVSWNDVHDVMQVLRDGGGIYTLGPQGSPNGGGRTYIRGNRIRSLTGLNAAGIYLDQGSAYLTVKDNVVADLPPADSSPWLRINGGSGHTHDIKATGNYADNTFKQIAGASLTTWPNQEGLTSWPAVAGAFVKFAGPEPAYRDVGAPRTGLDLAPRGTASASTEWSTDFSAAAAIDGRPGTGWAPSSNSGPWMMVDLGAAHRLSEIELVTRQDIDQPETRRNFWIWAWSKSDLSDLTLLADQGASSLDFRSTLRVGVNSEKAFRYIKVEKKVSEHMFVAELRVRGANANLALGRPSTTSSSGTLAPTAATDGYADSDWKSPAGGGWAWFQVDLGREYQLGQIQLVMSADTTLPELRRNFQVWVIDGSGTFWLVDSQRSPEFPAESVWSRGVQTPVPTRNVFIIKSNTTERLGLAEVRAFGRTPNLSAGGAAGSSASACSPSLAKDQSYVTGWCSAGDGGWWQLNLGGPRRLTGIRIAELTTSTIGLGQYEVWASNNSDMSLGHTVLAHQGQIILPSPSGIFVPVSDPLPYGYVAVVPMKAGAQLGEVEVFGD